MGRYRRYTYKGRNVELEGPTTFQSLRALHTYGPLPFQDNICTSQSEHKYLEKMPSTNFKVRNVEGANAENLVAATCSSRMHSVLVSHPGFPAHSHHHYLSRRHSLQQICTSQSSNRPSFPQISVVVGLHFRSRTLDYTDPIPT
jgi:hypothetical protein